MSSIHYAIFYLLLVLSYLAGFFTCAIFFGGSKSDEQDPGSKPDNWGHM